MACWDVSTRDAGPLTGQWAARRPSRPSAYTSTEYTQGEVVVVLGYCIVVQSEAGN